MAELFEDFYTWFLAEPVRLYRTGLAFLCPGAILLVAGIIGLMVVATQNVPTFGAAGKAPATLDTIFPWWVAFWVPESPLGFIVIALFSAAGFAIAWDGKQRMLRAASN